MNPIYLLLILSLLVLNLANAEASTLTMHQKNVDAGTVEMHVVLDPTEPIRGWEFKIRYHTSSLQCSRVLCSDFYYNRTYSNPGSIDNLNGTVIDIYGLILGPVGNITNETELCVITFSIFDRNDTSIDFYQVGICNGTQYVNCTSVNATLHFSSHYSYPGWNSFLDSVSWIIIRSGWVSFGNAPLSPDGHVADRFTAPQTRAPDSGTLSTFIGTLFAAILIMGLFLSVVYSFRRKK